MPTIPKLVAAICLSALAFHVSTLVMALMPESTDFGVFLPLNMVFGFLTGWIYVGPLAKKSMVEGLSYGLTGAAVLTFVSLFTQSSNEMMRLAMRHRFSGPLEAIAAVFQIAVEFGTLAFTPGVLISLVVGGMGSGALTYLAGLRWK